MRAYFQSRVYSRVILAVIALTIFVVTTIGACEMVSDDFKLNWEWPAGRTPNIRVLVEVHRIERESKGLFGIGRSPSMADHLPDSTLVFGSIVGGRNNFLGKEVQLRLPGGEIPDIVPGQRVGLGIVAENICICIQKAPVGLDDEAMNTWLGQMKCE